MFHDVDGPVTRHLMELIFLAIVFCYTNFQIKAENIFKKHLIGVVRPIPHHLIKN